jgi:sortase A
MADHPPESSRPSKHTKRMPAIGNLLIILGIALIGAALGLTAIRSSDVAATRDRIASYEATPGTSPASNWPPVVQPEATPENSPPPPPMPKPTHIKIPATGIDTKIVEVGYDIVTINGQQVIQWQVAEYAAGHNNTSASPGEGHNIVITGHDDWKGEVFRTLEKAKPGDEVVLTTEDGKDHLYSVTEIELRKEIGAPLEERLATGKFLEPMGEERVTLVTCWPYGVDDHRLIVIAKPVPSENTSLPPVAPKQ